jgi:hypothetical protein
MAMAATSGLNYAAYTALIGQDTTLPATPPGYGYAIITNKSEMLTIGGHLADGTAFSQSVPIGVDNEFPMFANIYTNKGILFGRLSFTLTTNGTPNGNLWWIKPPSKAGGTNGFVAIVPVVGSPWSNSFPTLKGLVPNGSTIGFSDGGFTTPVATTVSLSLSPLGGPVLTRTSGATNFVSGGIIQATGLMGVTLYNGNRQKVTGYGAFLQLQDFGGGYFLGTTNDGAMLLQP